MLGWTEIEITGGGAPRVNLSGSAAGRAAALGVTEILVTITHTRDQSIVMAIATGPKA
jgi:holo-[acyl-carrier protein] synthase